MKSKLAASTDNPLSALLTNLDENAKRELFLMLAPMVVTVEESPAPSPAHIQGAAKSTTKENFDLRDYMTLRLEFEDKQGECWFSFNYYTSGDAPQVDFYLPRSSQVLDCGNVPVKTKEKAKELIARTHTGGTKYFTSGSKTLFMLDFDFIDNDEQPIATFTVYDPTDNDENNEVSWLSIGRRQFNKKEVAASE